MKCYCCSGKHFAECCEPFITGKTTPPTAEALMRSRYSAYSTVAVDYILRSTHTSTRKLHNIREIEEWARASSWEKLEIISTLHGGTNDLVGVVEFRAYYRDLGFKQNIHHELSNFLKEDGVWFFLDGKIL